jgi:hypothetical protein
MLVAGFETLPSFGEDEVRLSIFRSLGEKFVKVDLPSVDEKFRSRKTILN